jgi:hypothetical protein
MAQFRHTKADVAADRRNRRCVIKWGQVYHCSYTAFIVQIIVKKGTPMLRCPKE